MVSLVDARTVRLAVNSLKSALHQFSNLYKKATDSGRVEDAVWSNAARLDLIDEQERLKKIFVSNALDIRNDGCAIRILVQRQKIHLALLVKILISLGLFHAFSLISSTPLSTHHLFNSSSPIEKKQFSRSHILANATGFLCF